MAKIAILDGRISADGRPFFNNENLQKSNLKDFWRFLSNKEAWHSSYKNSDKVQKRYKGTIKYASFFVTLQPENRHKQKEFSRKGTEFIYKFKHSNKKTYEKD